MNSIPETRGASGDAEAVEPRSVSPVGASSRPGSPAAQAQSNVPVWRIALTAFALSTLFPGSGHFYVGKWWRGVLWSSLFLLALLPLEMAAYVLLSSNEVTVLITLAALHGTFLPVCAAGPARLALHGPRIPSRRGRIWRLESYAAMVALVATLEIQAFRQNGFSSTRVQTSAFAPELNSGDEVTLLCTRFIRPVYEDILLLRARPAVPGPQTAAPSSEPSYLARVIARPGDQVRARSGRLEVNDVPVDATSIGHRRELEKAARVFRRRAFFSRIPFVQTSRAPDTFSSREDELGWGREDWGPFLLPADTLLVLPDLPRTNDSPSPGPPTSGRLVQKTDIEGRVIDRWWLSSLP
jgi:hypothetical protein